MDLRCNKTCCKHNKQYACKAKEIHVNRDTDCRTFANDKHKPKQEKLSKTMFEQAPEIAPFRAKDDVKIKCNAKCLFNKQGDCIANGITILDAKYDGKCGTFIEK